MNKRRYILWFFVGALLIGIWQAYSQRQYLKDLYIVSTTQLAPDALQLADTISLTERADFLYKASQTDLQPADQFSISCSGVQKEAIVLGCYTRQRIYIFDVTDERLEGVREVTAAHELLHAVYERLSEAEKLELSTLLDEQRKQNTDKSIAETLGLYKDLPKEDFYNEMHAIFGTESEKLSPELEAHYRQFFSDRSKIVDFALGYKDVFNRLKADADRLRKELSILEADKLRKEAQLESLKAQLDADQTRLNQLRSQNIEAYNLSVDAFNTKVNTYNSLVEQYKALIERMNRVIDQINKNVTEQNTLVQELDSNFESL